MSLRDCVGGRQVHEAVTGGFRLGAEDIVPTVGQDEFGFDAQTAIADIQADGSPEWGNSRKWLRSPF